MVDENDNIDKSKWEEIAKEVDAELPLEEKPGITHPSYEEISAQLTKTEEELSKCKNDLLRHLADMENTRKRSQREVENANKYALEKFVDSLLPVLDSFYHSLDASAEQKGVIREGVELTLKMFLSALEKFGVKEINPVGEIYDHTYHEAILAEEKADVAPGTIMQVFQRGYLLNGRLVRPARVIVAKALEK